MPPVTPVISTMWLYTFHQDGILPADVIVGLVKFAYQRLSSELPINGLMMKLSLMVHELCSRQAKIVELEPALDKVVEDWFADPGAVEDPDLRFRFYTFYAEESYRERIRKKLAEFKPTFTSTTTEGGEFCHLRIRSEEKGFGDSDITSDQIRLAAEVVIASREMGGHVHMYLSVQSVGDYETAWFVSGSRAEHLLFNGKGARIWGVTGLNDMSVTYHPMQDAALIGFLIQRWREAMTVIDLHRV